MWGRSLLVGDDRRSLRALLNDSGTEASTGTAVAVAASSLNYTKADNSCMDLILLPIPPCFFIHTT